MRIKQRKLSGVYEIVLEPRHDARGFFMRSYDKTIFEEYGVHREWVQENHSRSEKKGILRGLHFQFPPYAETKLVRVVKGVIFDVFVDIRKASPTFGQWDSIELSEEKKNMILIPRGFAHGFCSLAEISEVVYKVDNPYHPEAEGGITWNDDRLKIDWPVAQPVLSERDAALPTFQDFVKNGEGLEL